MWKDRGDIMAYTINANAKNVWIRDNEDTRDLSIQTDASSVYLDNGRTLEQELGEGSMVSNVATVDSAMSKIIDGTLDGVYESGVMYGKTMVNIMKPVEDITKVGNGTYSGFYLNESGLIKNLKTDTDYLFVVHVKSNTLTGSTTYSLDFGNTDPNNPSQQACFITRQHLPHDALGTYKFIMRTRDSFDGMAFVSRNQLLNKATGGSITFNYMILEYQEGMENWDIPFFGGICDVKMPILRNVGKNLLNMRNVGIQGTYRCSATNNGDETITITGTGDGTGEGYVVFDHPIQLEKGKTYSFGFKSDGSYSATNGTDSVEAFLLKDAKTTIYQQMQGFKTVFTCHTSGVYYPRFDVNKNNTTHKFWDIQLEESPATTTYEDYKTNILRTPETLTLRSLPNGVRDELNLKTGEYIQRVGEIVLDGSLNAEGIYNEVGETTTGFFFPLDTIQIKGGDSETVPNQIISDKFRTENHECQWMYGMLLDEEFLSATSDGRIAVRLLTTKASTLDEFHQYLQSNPITVQYELAEPITTIVEPLTIPFAYQNGHIILESGHEGQSLLPTLEYSTVVNRTGQVESVAKTIQTQEKQLTMLEQMLIQNIIGLDYSNTVLALNLKINEVM